MHDLLVVGRPAASVVTGARGFFMQTTPAMDTELLELGPYDAMPDGPYSGLRMQDVPPEYLHRLWTVGHKSKDMTCPVAAYIRSHLDALKEELPDRKW